MIPTINSTLNHLDEQVLMHFNQYVKKLSLFGVSDAKNLTLMLIIKELLEDENVLDEDKLELNLKLIELKKTLNII